jgi:hypothetical protein
MFHSEDPVERLVYLRLPTRSQFKGTNKIPNICIFDEQNVSKAKLGRSLYIYM